MGINSEIEQQLMTDANLRKRNSNDLARRFGIPVDEIRSIRKEANIKRLENIVDKVSESIQDVSEMCKKINNDKGTLESSIELTFEPQDDIQLAKLHKIDLKKYKISNYWSKLKSNGKFTSSVLCTLRKLDSDLESQKHLLIKELYTISKNEYKIIKPNGKYSYEINIPDVHFGKLSWKEESGEDYDLSIACKRYEEAISNLLSLVNLEDIEEIIFPIGNDMINIDSRNNETFAGTRQDSDSRFFKIVRVVKEILIKNINSLSLIAPVKVIVISGNHDPETMFMLGEILDAYYYNNNNVNIDNSAKQRKYYRYGKCGFQYTHGNEENHKDLGLIFATEESQLWADTQFRFCKVGHFHTNKKISYLSIDEFQGFQVQVLPSLSGSDAYHKSKGYMSLKQAKGFLYHKEKGQLAEYTFNVCLK